MNKPRLTQEQIEEAKNMKESGKFTMEEIAQRFNSSVKRMEKYIGVLA